MSALPPIATLIAVDDLADQEGQPFQGLGLFVPVPVIDALHAWDGVAEKSLGNVGVYHSPAHQGAGSAAKILDAPAKGQKGISQHIDHAARSPQPRGFAPQNAGSGRTIGD